MESATDRKKLFSLRQHLNIRWRHRTQTEDKNSISKNSRNYRNGGNERVLYSSGCSTVKKKTLTSAGNRKGYTAAGSRGKQRAKERRPYRGNKSNVLINKIEIHTHRNRVAEHGAYRSSVNTDCGDTAKHVACNELRRRALQALEELVKPDPVKTTVVDMTALNLVELTRKKTRKPVLEQLLELQRM